MKAPGPRRRRKVRRLSVLLAAILVLAVGGWGAGLLWFVEQIPKAVEDGTTPTDAIVVLTGGQGRLDEALALLAANLAGRLFVSGVYRGVDVKTLLDTARSGSSVPENLIGIGDATNTVGNAAETAAWARYFGIRSIRLVTASYHMPRSLLEFRHALPEVRVVPHPVFSDNVKQKEWWAWPGTTALIAREYTKYLLVRVRQSIEWRSSESPR
ncbi:MAG: YdcF family protein [Rhodospirillales bacterium]|jgi:uncharacterized SAM-binding protein YcdF (DUF218 family)|nr:YdcF family protein [Rhodospirillales bacterium]